MVKKTISMPDDLYDEAVDSHPADETFSGIVQRALREYLDERDTSDTAQAEAR